MHAHKIGAAVVPLALLFPATRSALGHGTHAAQPSAIIDPLITHHAVLEDELKLNFFTSRHDESDTTRGETSLELAYALNDLIGAEAFIPFGVVSAAGEHQTGFGDVELQFPKVSFLRRYGWVMTAYAAVVAPTGDETRGLGREGWVIAPHLLTDLAFGPIGVQLNGAVEAGFEGDAAAELRGSVAYTAELSQAKEVFLSPLVELDSEIPVRGDEHSALLVVPGVKLGLGGWHVGAGVRLPVAGERPFDFEALLQVGYHVSWQRLNG